MWKIEKPLGAGRKASRLVRFALLSECHITYIDAKAVGIKFEEK